MFTILRYNEGVKELHERPVASIIIALIIKKHVDIENIFINNVTLLLIVDV